MLSSRPVAEDRDSGGAAFWDGGVEELSMRRFKARVKIIAGNPLGWIWEEGRVSFARIMVPPVAGFPARGRFLIDVVHCQFVRSVANGVRVGCLQRLWRRGAALLGGGARSMRRFWSSRQSVYNDVVTERVAGTAP